MTRSVELRSDTFTRPTEAMRRAMYEAEVGDDVWGEDPTVVALEEESARLLGKESALFVTSGTQGNLVGLLCHTNPGDEVLVGDQSHVFWYEVAGAAVVGGLQLRTLTNLSNGGLDAAAVSGAIRTEDVHFPPTGCIALENTHNRCGGAVVPLEVMSQVAEVARRACVPVHLDGARFFNAALSLGVAPAALAEHADSVTFCLSKALGAPVGSVLCGSAAYIERARRWRKLLGGGLRQVGILAAAGQVAIRDHVDRLAEDHANALKLAQGLSQVQGIVIDPETVKSNIVAFDVAGLTVAAEQFVEQLDQFGVRVATSGPTQIRAVTSYEVSASDIEYALETVNRLIPQRAAAIA